MLTFGYFYAFFCTKRANKHIMARPSVFLCVYSLELPDGCQLNLWLGLTLNGNSTQEL
jgi:hypothetical protein